MKMQKLWYFAALITLALLPLVGCSDGGSGTNPVTPVEAGYKVTVSGDVKTTGKSVALSPYSTSTVNKVYVIDAQAGTVLTSGAITDGKFKDLTFTLPSPKSILVFKAVVAAGTVRSIVPIDLESNKPAAGTIVSDIQPINIAINSNTDAIAKTVSSLLGLSGILGDGGQTLASKSKTYADALKLVTDNGGQALGYNGGVLELTGTVNSSLLPAKAYVDFTADDVLNVKLGGAVASAFIPGKNPIVNITVTNVKTGKGISGLPASKFTVHFAQLKADGSTWLNYKLNPTGTFQGTSDRSFLPASIPATSNTIIDKGDGSYTITLGIDVTNSDALVLSKADTATATSAKLAYDANLVHRVAISVNATGAINPATNAAQASNPNNVASLVYDFTPATGAVYVNPNGGNFARDIVTMAACDACHGPLVNHGHHFGSRPDTKMCVTCHTVQNKKTGKPSTEMTNLIHTVHMGHDLAVPVTDIGGIDASHIKYPQDQRNCTTCHTGKDSINLVGLKPTEFACKSCHNDGKSHIVTNKACSECHAAGSFGTNHITPVKTANNQALPTGKGLASFAFEITEVTVDATMHPVIKFKPTKDGAALTFNSYVDATSVLVTGFTGGPTLYVAMARPQDGITAPADWNASASATLANIWAGVASNTLTGPVDGVYTATLNSVTIPADAVMVTGSIQSNGFVLVGGEATLNKDFNGDGDKSDNYTIPYQGSTKVATGYTARRVVVSNAKCNACHEQLGTKPIFHSGGRNDAPSCQLCHLPNRANNGWAVNVSTFVHGLHGASKRTVPYTWHKEIEADGVTVGWSGEAIGYPGVLRNCEQCHVAGGYDYTIARSLTDKMLYTTVASGIADNASTPSKAASMSPYVTNGTDYGSTYSGNTFTAAPTEAAGTTLVISPISAACFSCHDTAAAKSHMVSNGGSIYEARATALAKKESCLVCHGPRGADTTLPVTGAVPTIKTVHRWW